MLARAMLFPRILLVVFLFTQPPGWQHRANAVDSWTDTRLPETNGLALWLDAGRQNAARRAHARAPVPEGNPLAQWFDGSGHQRAVTQRIAAARPRFHQAFTGAFVEFDGQDDFLAASGVGFCASHATVTLVAGL